MASTVTTGEEDYEYNYYNNDWMLYAHMPHDANWNLNSYKKIMCLKTVEESITLFESIDDIMYKNCMLFLMRENIKPIWEDVQNRDGGCFSFKIKNMYVSQVWKDLMYLIMGDTLSSDKEFMKSVNGASISPKKDFCIIKIWMKTRKFTKLTSLNEIKNLNKNGVLFKRIEPKY